MIIWDYFIYFAALASLLWIGGAVTAYFKSMRTASALLSGLGTMVLMGFILIMWIALGRPPMRTTGETRLWYSLFLSLAGMIISVIWRYRWIPTYSSAMAIMFLCINLFKPEIHSQALMPALQSPWFVPHVTVYMMSYAMLGAATILALRMLLKPSFESTDVRRCDMLVGIGWGLFTLGMVMGALWAKEAWGDWWAWDPKETWALITWTGYLLYMHSRSLVKDRRILNCLLVLCFVMLCMCWFGVNYLPSAGVGSMHTY